MKPVDVNQPEVLRYMADYYFIEEESRNKSYKEEDTVKLIKDYISRRQYQQEEAEDTDVHKKSISDVKSIFEKKRYRNN